MKLLLITFLMTASVNAFAAGCKIQLNIGSKNYSTLGDIELVYKDASDLENLKQKIRSLDCKVLGRESDSASEGSASYRPGKYYVEVQGVFANSGVDPDTGVIHLGETTGAKVTIFTSYSPNSRSGICSEFTVNFFGGAASVGPASAQPYLDNLNGQVTSAIQSCLKLNP
jgi:hypothetical protein